MDDYDFVEDIEGDDASKGLKHDAPDVTYLAMLDHLNTQEKDRLLHYLPRDSDQWFELSTNELAAAWEREGDN